VKGGAARFYGSLAALAAAGLAAAAAWSAARFPQEFAATVAREDLGYETSRACLRCHPDHTASWARTFHRTMTQEACAESVLGDFSGATFEFLGRVAKMSREGDCFFVDYEDAAGRRLARHRVARTVGSRRYQQYLTLDEGRGLYLRLPVAWHVERERWIHLNGAFLFPDSENWDQHLASWNDNCVFCHNVKATPRALLSRELADPSGPTPVNRKVFLGTAVEELGIACEACHGPGEEHVRRNADPLRRAFLHLGGDADPTIVNPERLSKERSAQVCGHCHGARLPVDPFEFVLHTMGEKGDPYVPGEDLSRWWRPIQRDSRVFEDGEMGGETTFALRFWPDGEARLTAYEYQGLLQSPCFQRGELTCISCHSMHKGDPRGQLTEEMRGDGACLQCHRSIAEDLRAHTMHDPAGSGSRCLECHMPRDTYGILSIHRTHRISNPDPAAAAREGRPDACTLCHLDRTAHWAAESATAWWGESYEWKGGVVEADLAESVRDLLSGDVVERCVAAWSMGRPDAPLDGDARAWTIPLLLLALEDVYPAVRHFAWASLESVLADFSVARRSRFESLPEVEALATRKERFEALRFWTGAWIGSDRSRLSHPGSAAALLPDGLPDLDRVYALVRGQASKAIAIGE
jgi:predicted CXXCH cytochrome family protein